MQNMSIMTALHIQILDLWQLFFKVDTLSSPMHASLNNPSYGL